MENIAYFLLRKLRQIRRILGRFQRHRLDLPQRMPHWDIDG
jgi:hypothetical protein